MDFFGFPLFYRKFSDRIFWSLSFVFFVLYLKLFSPAASKLVGCWSLFFFIKNVII